MLRFVADENFNQDIVRGLLLRLPRLDVVCAQDCGLTGSDDPRLLAWATKNDRILLTHDQATMPFYAYQRLITGETLPGVFVLNDRFPIGLAIEEILLLVDCTEQSEWANQVAFLPI